MSAEDLLSRTFVEVTDATEYPTTTPSSVVARFETQRGARRRRIAYAAAAAAIVLVGGVSAAAWLRDDTPSTPAPAGPLGKLGLGAPPRIDYLDRTSFVTTSGERFTSPVLAAATAAVAWGKGVLVAGQPTARHPFPDVSFVSGGSTSSVGCGAPSFAVPAGGGDPVYWLSSECKVNRGGHFVQGYTSTDTPVGATFTPVGEVSGGIVAVGSATQLRIPSHALVFPLDHSRWVPLHLLQPRAASAASDLVCGVARNGSDDAVVDASTGDVRWRTSWTLSKFSASGRYVVGTLGPRFGNSGENAVAIFDASTGRQVTRSSFTDLTLVGLPAWERDGSVLVVVQDARGREAILRVGLDGSLSRTTPVVQDVPPPDSGRPPPTVLRLASTP